MGRSERVRLEVQEWMQRAERDLQAAKNELEASVPLPEMTAYHAQQAVEKALKAFLTLHSTPFPFTHDLVELQTRCESIDPDFDRFEVAARTLMPYATEFRYPGGPLAPSGADATQALQTADEVLQFVRKRI